MSFNLQGLPESESLSHTHDERRDELTCFSAADATVRIWSSDTGKCLKVLEGHLAGISTLAWSPDGKTIASGSDDKTIWLWNFATGKPHSHPLIGHHHYIYSVAFSPKGNILVSGSYDEAVILWDVRTRNILRTLPAHSDPVGGVDFVSTFQRHCFIDEC